MSVIIIQQLEGYVYMFMNKINMPQTCPYNFYKQSIKLLQKVVSQEDTQV